MKLTEAICNACQNCLGNDPNQCPIIKIAKEHVEQAEKRIWEMFRLSCDYNLKSLKCPNSCNHNNSNSLCDFTNCPLAKEGKE
jgi:hypothetical protein